MRIRGRSKHGVIALATAWNVLLSPVAPLLLTAQTPSTPAPAKPATPPAATPKPAAPATAAAKQAAPATAAPKPATPATPASTAAAAPRTFDPDGGWPRDFATTSGGAIRIFQPQVASWDGQKKMVLYAAVSYAAKGATTPSLGTIKLEADSSVAVSERLVNFTNIKITESTFPNLTNDQQKQVASDIIALVPEGALVLGLDRVLARLDKSTIIPKNITDVKADPPAIFYSESPAILMNVDGDPIWSPIRDNDLKFAVNTNWDLFQDTASNTLFLRNNDYWLKASNVKGPWKPAGKLPDSFAKLPEDGGNWKEVKAALPGRQVKESDLPTVFVSTTPAEMILLRGNPNYLTVEGTQLLWVSNTDSDVFRLGKGGSVYYLVSGRWFSAPDFSGPWKFATTTLPEEFKKIPLSHARSRVLASVPGTDQAAEAVLLAQIPQTATVNKKEIKAPEVDFDGGAPKFEPIEKTSLQYAVNTDKDIIKVGDAYYMCYQGVWFTSKSAEGPWAATGSVPGQIYEIPASSPVHNVTYVTVENDTPDTAVYVTAAAYTGMMVAWGCVVWGSGWYYPPYIGYGGYYPWYRPYYPSYGYHASYNPWTGAYSRGVVAYGPYGGAGAGARYNPRTGTYARGAAAWGPYGARGVASAYNPRTGTGAVTRQGSGVYGSWGQTAVSRGDNWASTSRVTNRATGATTRATQGSNGGAALTRNGQLNNSGIVRTGSGDVYAGRDGNVYKRNGDGSWSPTSGTNRPDAATTGQLNRDRAARTEGAQRTRDYGASGRTGGSTYRPSGGGSMSRPSGGMSRPMPRGGGGGRRR